MFVVINLYRKASCLWNSKGWPISCHWIVFVGLKYIRNKHLWSRSFFTLNWERRKKKLSCCCHLITKRQEALGTKRFRRHDVTGSRLRIYINVNNIPTSRTQPQMTTPTHWNNNLVWEPSVLDVFSIATLSIIVKKKLWKVSISFFKQEIFISYKN